MHGEKSNEQIVSRLSIALVLIVLTVKIVVALFTTSISFYAELSDSFMDLIAVLITYLALKEGKKPADNRHMFGHYKINSVAGFVQSILIIQLYCFILYQAIQTIINIDTYEPENSLLAAFSLIVVLIMVFFVSRKVVAIGKKSKNQAVIAQGLNFRGDFYRNISVIVGLVLSNFGLQILDPIVAGIFSIISIVNGIRVLRQSFNELTDANTVGDDEIDKIENLIKQIEGVSHIDSLALKTAGKYLDASISIRLHEKISVLHGNTISNQIRKVINSTCPTYKKNILIQFNIANPDKSIAYFDEIREIVVQDEEKYDIHNIIIDRFKDTLLIQFHIKIAFDTSLERAHTIATKVEKQIQHRLENYSKDIKIQVISHIEPAERREMMHSHPLEQTERKDLNTFISTLVEMDDQIQSFHDLKIIEMDDRIQSFSLIISIILDSSLSVGEAHAIAEKLEYDLHFAFHNLNHCLIHTESISKST